MISAKCPICGKALSAAKEPSLPFCSARCKQIDLGRWLGGNYVVPGRPLEEEELDEANRDAGNADPDEE